MTRAYRLWRAWYAMEDCRPERDTDAYASWVARCARLNVAARRADRLALRRRYDVDALYGPVRS